MFDRLQFGLVLDLMCELYINNGNKFRNVLVILKSKKPSFWCMSSENIFKDYLLIVIVKGDMRLS